MKVLVVGLNPSKRWGKSSSVRNLNKWLDELNLKRVSFINLYENYDIDRGENQKARIKQMAKAYDKVLALGTAVSSALDSVQVDHYPLPHPSGLNRQLNNPKFVHEKLQSCKNYLYGDKHAIL